MPGVSLARLRHRHEEGVIKIRPDAVRRCRNTFCREFAGLLNDAIDAGLTDICLAIGDKHYSIDRLLIEMVADLKPPSDPGLVQGRRAIYLYRVDRPFQQFLVFNWL